MFRAKEVRRTEAPEGAVKRRGFPKIQPLKLKKVRMVSFLRILFLMKLAQQQKLELRADARLQLQEELKNLRRSPVSRMTLQCQTR